MMGQSRTCIQTTNTIKDILLRREQIMINDLVQEADNAQAELKG